MTNLFKDYLFKIKNPRTGILGIYLEFREAYIQIFRGFKTTYQK